MKADCVEEALYSVVRDKRELKSYLPLSLLLAMSDVRYLSKKFILELIDLYKSLPSLWNLKSKDYYDRSKKNADYEIMVKKLREVEPEATREMVTKKINSWRGSRRKELSKIKHSIEAGGEVYVPKLWYYKFMDFVDGQELTEAEKASVNASSSESQVDTDTDSVTIASRFSVSSTSQQVPSVVAFTTQTPAKRQTKRKRKPPREETKAVSHEAFGRYVAHKLENLPATQRILVEKLINEAIFEAEMGNLNRNCYVHVPADKEYLII